MGPIIRICTWESGRIRIAGHINIAGTVQDNIPAIVARRSRAPEKGGGHKYVQISAQFGYEHIAICTFDFIICPGG